VIVNVLHYQKLAHWLAIFLHHGHGIGYREWYESLKDRVKNDPRFPRLHEAARFTLDYYQSIASGAQRRLSFPEYGNVVWPIEEAVFLLLSKDFDGLFAELERLAVELAAERGIDLDPRLLSELIEYQAAQVPRAEGPRVDLLTLEHDWPSYFERILRGEPASLERRALSLRVVDQHRTGGDLATYALKVAWYARSATDIPYRLESLVPLYEAASA
jgi:hypothetical protein